MHGVVAALVLLMPWPLSYTPLWLILLSLVVFDCVRSQRRIHARQGEIKLLNRLPSALAKGGVGYHRHPVGD